MVVTAMDKPSMPIFCKNAFVRMDSPTGRGFSSITSFV